MEYVVLLQSCNENSRTVVIVDAWKCNVGPTSQKRVAGCEYYLRGSRRTKSTTSMPGKGHAATEHSI